MRICFTEYLFVFNEKNRLLLMTYKFFGKIKCVIVYFCTKEHKKWKKQWVILF